MRVALRLITYQDYRDKESISLLTEWRKKNSFAYQGDYKITQKSVKLWLKKFVLDNPDRFLFWIVVDGVEVGHIGVKNIKKGSVEIDNLARGLEEYKGAMSEALKQVLFMYSDRKIWLRVLRSNYHALKFYEKNGFVIYKDEWDFLYMKYEKNTL